MYFNEPLIREEAVVGKQVTMPVGAHLFDEVVHLTGLTEYGMRKVDHRPSGPPASRRPL